MARFLTIAEYGILATLMSIIYLISISSESVQTIVTKYASRIQNGENSGKIRFLFRKFSGKGMKIALVVFGLYVFISPIISSLLGINIFLIILTGTTVFGYFLVPIGRGILQGTKKFYTLGSNYILEALIKLVLAIALVFIGMSVFGSIFAIVISLFAAFVLSIFGFRYIYKHDKERLEIQGLYSYGFSVFVLVSSILIILSMDMLIAKIIFTEDVAGKYAVASIIGKMIFFGTFPISKAMFPLTSEKENSEKEAKKLLVKSLAMLLFIAVCTLFIFAFFPKLFVLILFSKKYLEISSFIIFTGTGFTFLSISNLLLIYSLSQNRKIVWSKAGVYIVFIILVEFLFLIFSADSLATYSLSLMFANIIIFISTLFFIKSWRK